MIPTTPDAPSPRKLALFGLSWIAAHVAVAMLIDETLVGRTGRQAPLPAGFWGAISFVVQVPLLLTRLQTWHVALRWIAAATLLFGFVLLVGAPFMAGLFYGLSYQLCPGSTTPICGQLFLLVVLVPSGLAAGYLQWLLGRRHARGMVWLIPAQVVGMVAFALLFGQVAYAPGSLVPEAIPASVVASLGYALVVGLGLPHLCSRQR